jgi:uroporphyrinogen III methyltransferase/synthase
MTDMSPGKVFLVGAGPGDPGLLTMRGRDVLARADLVLYDGLANPLLLRLADCPCERTARTQVGGGRIVLQQEINERLIREAHSGKDVVRLKGGDPFIFGRGSEEVAALEAAGIPFEVIPGITAATAAGEYAGFSFTHRDIASAVAFVTGHEDPSRDAPRLDYAALASFPGTLVFYMGLGRVQDICSQLIREGKPGHTSAAVVCQASLPQQQVVISTLSELPTVVTASGLRPPSLIVVGECVDLRPTCSWFEQGPLFGQSVGITRPNHQSDDIAGRIVTLSGQPVIMPLIEIRAIDEEQAAMVDEVLARLDDYQWLVFTSVNGVAAFFDRLWQTGRDVRRIGQLQIAATGSATAAALETRGLRADIVPGSFRAEELAQSLSSHVNGQRVLWARASRGRDVLPRTLTTAGAIVDEVVVYGNDDVEQFDALVLDRIRSGSLDWVGLSSPSIARQFAKLLAAHEIAVSTLRTKIATISPVTSHAATEAGLPVAVEAATYTWDGIIDAIVESGQHVAD